MPGTWARSPQSVNPWSRHEASRHDGDRAGGARSLTRSHDACAARCGGLRRWAANVVNVSVKTIPPSCRVTPRDGPAIDGKDETSDDHRRLSPFALNEVACVTATRSSFTSTSSRLHPSSRGAHPPATATSWLSG